MAKETHTIRVWARRGDRRTLDLSIDSPDARDLALARVAVLKRDPWVDGIEVEEHVVLTEDRDGTLPAHRGTIHWRRGGHGWRRLPDGRRAG